MTKGPLIATSPIDDVASKPQGVRTRRSAVGLVAALLLTLAVLAAMPAIQLLIATFRSKSPVYPDAEWTLSNWTALLEPDFVSALWETLVLASVVALGAVIVGGGLAWLVVRTDVRLPRVIEILSILPFLISPFVIASGWIAAFRPRAGLVNAFLLQPIFGFEVNIYSWIGIVIVMVSWLSPMAYIFAATSLSAADGAMDEASVVAGANKWRTVRWITFPLMKPALVAVALLIFVSGAEMFSVPALLGRPIGYENLAYRIYLEIATAPPNWMGAAVSGAVLVLIVAIGVWLNRLVLSRSERYVTVSGKPQKVSRIRLGRHRNWVTGTVLSFLLLVVVLPLVSVAVGSVVSVQGVGQVAFNLDPYSILLTPRTRASVVNTVALSGFTPILVISIALASAIVVKRSRSSVIRGLVDFLNVLPAAFPGIVLGVAVLWLYFPVTWLPIYGTVLMLLVAYMGRYLPQGYRNLGSGLAQAGAELEEASRVAGASSSQTTRFITIPILKPALSYTFLLLFVSVAREATTSIILNATAGVEALAPLLWETISTGNLRQAYVLGLLQVVIVGSVLLAARRLVSTDLTKIGGRNRLEDVAE